MTSDYEFTDIAKLEAFAIKDYSAIDPILTNAVLNAKISDAERYVIGYINHDFDGETIPPAITLVTNMIAKTMLDNYMIEEGFGKFREELGIVKPILEDFDIIAILEEFRTKYKKSHVVIKKRRHVNPWQIGTSKLRY